VGSNVSHRGDNRIAKLTFKFDSIYEMPEDAVQTVDETMTKTSPKVTTMTNWSGTNWKARSAVSDRIGRVRKKLGSLQENYSILKALFSLRFPSRRGHGSTICFSMGRLPTEATASRITVIPSVTCTELTNRFLKLPKT